MLPFTPTVYVYMCMYNMYMYMYGRVGRRDERLS